MVMEIHCRVINHVNWMLDPSKYPGFESWSYLITLSQHVHQSSLNGFKGQLVCRLPLIHAPERPLGIIRKTVGEYPQLQNLAKVRITGPRWCSVMHVQ
jgi:hypothetical protein